MEKQESVRSCSVIILKVCVWLSFIAYFDKHKYSRRRSKMKVPIFSVLIFNAISISVGFQQNMKSTQRTRLNLQLSTTSTQSLIKKGKMKEVQALLQEVESNKADHYITKYLNEGVYPLGIGAPLMNFYDFSYSKPGSLKVVAEYNQKAKTGFILGIPSPEVVGDIFRDTVHAVVISMDKRNGGNTVHDFRRFTIEQYKARKSQPGPIPVLWNDFIVDEIQIIQAAALGGAGVVLYPEVTDNLKQLIDTAHEYKLGAIVLAKDAKEVHTAISAGARSVSLYNLDENKFVEVRKEIGKIPDNVQIGAKLRAEGDFSTFAEIDTAWLLRDNEFNFIWPSTEAIFANNVNDIYNTLLALRAKASRQFYSPRQFFMERNKEGSQEYLGDILY